MPCIIKKISLIGTITTCAIFAILIISTSSCGNDKGSFYIEGTIDEGTIDGRTYRISGFVQAGSGASGTGIMGADTQTDFVNGINAWTITCSGTTTGTYNTVSDAILYNVDGTYFYLGSGSILSITITSYGDVVEGTFDGQITYSGNAQDYPISGSFRAPMQ